MTYVNFLEQGFSSLGCLNMTDVIEELLSSGWCRCKANAHVCVEDDFTTLYREKVSVSSALLKMWGISAD